LQDPENGSWARTGPHITALDTDSALLQLPVQIETPVKLDADHSMVVKFNSKTAYGYKTALNYLRAFEKEAPEVVWDRFCKWSKRIFL
jgi:protein SERAC1